MFFWPYEKLILVLQQGNLISQLLNPLLSEGVHGKTMRSVLARPGVLKGTRQSGHSRHGGQDMHVPSKRHGKPATF